MNIVTLRAVKTIHHGVGTISAGQEFRATETFAEQVLASGQAVRSGTRQVWDKLHWPNSHIVCIASGPSLTAEDCEAVRRWRAVWTAADRFVIVINTSYKAAPWADVLYASDEGWWNNYNVRVAHEFRGWRFTGLPVGDEAPKHIAKYDLPYVLLEYGSGLNRKVGYANRGGNSGYQAIGLAYLAGATKITLLGYDCTADGEREHWHPEHEFYSHADRPYRSWASMYPDLYDDLRETGVKLVNASRRTAIPKVPRLSLEEALRG